MGESRKEQKQAVGAETLGVKALAHSLPGLSPDQGAVASLASELSPHPCFLQSAGKVEGDGWA